MRSGNVALGVQAEIPPAVIESSAGKLGLVDNGRRSDRSLDVPSSSNRSDIVLTAPAGSALVDICRGTRQSALETPR